MKHILPLVLVALTVNGQVYDPETLPEPLDPMAAQPQHKIVPITWGIELPPPRRAVVDSLTYELTYRITGGGWVPATNPPGSQHYDATIEVHLVRADGTKEFIATVDGTYTHDGCCDNPEVWVRKALESTKTTQPIEGVDYFTFPIITNDITLTHTIFKDLAVTTTTNWIPYRGTHEIGVIEQTTEAILVWKGKTNRFVLETEIIGVTPKREIPMTIRGGTNVFRENPWWIKPGYKIETVPLGTLELQMGGTAPIYHATNSLTIEVE